MQTEETYLISIANDDIVVHVSHSHLDLEKFSTPFSSLLDWHNLALRSSPPIVPS